MNEAIQERIFKIFPNFISSQNELTQGLSLQLLKKLVEIDLSKPEK